MKLNDLPPELLIQVLKLAIAGQFSASIVTKLKPGIRLKPGCEALCLVCSGWFDLIRGGQDMLVQVSVVNGEVEYTQSREDLESATCDLVVTLSSFEHPNLRQDHHLWLSLITSHSYRLVSLFIGLERSTVELGTAIELLGAGKADLNRMQALTCKFSHAESMQTLLETWIMPSLQSLRMLTIPPQWSRAACSQLANLNSLAINLKSRHQHPSQRDDLYTLFESCPLLENLHVRDPHNELLYGLQPIVLPKLQKCRLHCSGHFIWNFMVSAVLPLLDDLDIKQNEGFDEYSCEKLFVDKQIQLNCLHTMSALNVGSSGFEFLRAARMVNLRELRMTQSQVVRSLESTPLHLPSLMRLDLSLHTREINWILRAICHPKGTWPSIQYLSLNIYPGMPFVEIMKGVEANALQLVSTLCLKDFGQLKVIRGILDLASNIQTLKLTAFLLDLQETDVISKSLQRSGPGESVLELIHPVKLPRLRNLWVYAVKRPSDLVALVKQFKDHGAPLQHLVLGSRMGQRNLSELEKLVESTVIRPGWDSSGRHFDPSLKENA